MVARISVLFFPLLWLCSCSLQNHDMADVSQYKAIFTEPPKNVPTVRTPDGPLVGNGDIGITMGGTPDKLSFYIGKNDFWWPYEEYPFGIALPGALHVSIPVLEGAEYYAEQRLDEADIISRFTKGDLQVNINVLVPATRNMVIFEFSANQDCPVNLELQTGYTPVSLSTDPEPEHFRTPQTESHTSINRSGRENGVCWVTRSFDNPDFAWPCHIAMAMKTPESTMQGARITNPREDERTVSSVLELKPGQTETIAIAIYTNFDDNDWQRTAITEADAFKPSDMKMLRQEHRAWWDRFWKESYVSIGDSLVERFYYASTYIFAMSSRAGKFAPGIWGSFITDENSLWGGDYHLNYNYQGPFWAWYSSNHLSLVDNYEQPLLDYMERGREHARELLNCRGIYYPVGLGPKGLCTSRWPRPERMKDIFGTTDNTFEGGYQFHGQKINAVFGASNMLMRFYSTFDEDYAKRVYPYLLACADFWEDYLSYEDGRYVVRDDHFNETSPNRRNQGDVSAQWGDMNSTLSLGLVSMLFRGVLTVSEFLEVDAARHEKWEEILYDLSKFPVGEANDGRLSLKNMERGPGDVEAPTRGLNRISIHGLVLPSGIIGPLMNPAINNILLSDISRWSENKRNRGSWGGGGGFETVYPGAVRVGYDANVIFEELKERIEMQHLPNLWITQGGGGVETLTGVPLTINEMLMQSYEGIIRLFPNWTGKDARFRDLRAYGAFLVSSSMKDGVIPSVTILSEKGQRCFIENPWKGSKVQATSDRGRRGVFDDDFLALSTYVNETITLTKKKK